MSELHLLDILAARHGCFISDLNLADFLRKKALSDLFYAVWKKARILCINGRMRCAISPGMNGSFPA